MFKLAVLGAIAHRLQRRTACKIKKSFNEGEKKRGGKQENENKDDIGFR